ncbi:Na+/H+ antiporter NhaC family protein, partial [Myxococcota bacterium]|nr:Na+/H+ antiporter NhaC family protein [Myxococcota bacterium]
MTNQSPDQKATLEFVGGPALSALPIIFFVIWAISICIAGAPDIRGLILGVVFGLALGMFFSRSKWESYAEEIFVGMSDKVGVVAIVAWFWAGMFAQVLQAGGLVKGLAWIGAQAGVTGGFFVGATFLLAAVFATAVGTGYGTVVAFTTLLFPAGVLVGADPLILFAAILSGAALGDNLAPVSDTTIVSAVTQNTDVPGVVRSRLKYAAIAAVPSLILFVVLGGGKEVGSVSEAGAMIAAQTSPEGLLLLIPFALVVTLALKGNHLLTSLTWGIMLAVLMIGGLNLGGDLGGWSSILSIDTVGGKVNGALVEGIAGYFEMAVLILLIVAASHIMKAGGAMDAMVNFLLARAGDSVNRAEFSSWLIVFVLNIFITINTAAEIAAAPFVRLLGTAHRI